MRTDVEDFGAGCLKAYTEVSKTTGFLKREPTSESTIIGKNVLDATKL